MTTLIDTNAPHSLVVKAFLEGSKREVWEDASEQTRVWMKRKGYEPALGCCLPSSVAKDRDADV